MATPEGEGQTGAASFEGANVIKGLEISRDADGVITGIERTGGPSQNETPAPRFEAPETPHQPQPENNNSRVSEARQRITVVHPDGKPSPRAEAAPVLKGLSVESTSSGKGVEAAPVAPEKEANENLKFNIGDIVSVTRSEKSGGGREHDWKVIGRDEKGKIITESPRGEGYRHYNDEQLAAAQFVDGDPVKHFSERGGNENWQVFGKVEDGEVLIVTGGDPMPNGERTPGYRRRMSVAELFAEQQPGYQPPKQETTASAASGEPAEPKKSWRQRLGERIAGK